MTMLSTLNELRQGHGVWLGAHPYGDDTDTTERLYHETAREALFLAAIDEARREVEAHESPGYLVGDHAETWAEADAELAADQTAAARESMQ